ncbi:MAG: amidohydrolase family protein [Proteobacteria bacterium]|nr:amidohydrolase family protein [Pseudomonadota bacterium]
MKGDDGGAPLPIRLDSTSNGEFAPVPLPAHCVAANRRAARAIDENAARLDVSRRRFVTSACGAATALLAMNDAFAAVGGQGGFYDLPAEAAFEPELARATLAGDGLVFDIQGHHVTPDRPWRKRSAFWRRTIRNFPFADCGFPDEIECFSARQFVKEIFVDSDTDMAVLSFVPEPDLVAAPLHIEEAASTRAIVDAMAGSKRLLLHGPVHPGFPGELEHMDELAERFQVAAWKTYTQYGPDGNGYWLDSEQVGIPFVEKARSLGVKVICVHKGFPLPGMRYEHSRCRDVGRVAKLFPDVDFIIYHSGYQTGIVEGPYAGGGDSGGIDSLVRSLRENEIAPGSNVYAELGSTWRFLMRDLEQAAHALGKLFAAVGERNVLWGTDSIWYGSPQDQIQAFRAFQIAPALREAHGYPEITPELRAGVFGRNALRPYGLPPELATNPPEPLARALDPERLEPSFETYGPRTRREFLRFLQLSG